MLRLICGYAPQSRSSLEEKQCYCGEVNDEWNELIVYLSDFNGHVGRHINGFNGVYG